MWPYVLVGVTAAGWVAGIPWYGPWRVGVNGEHRGVLVVGNEVSLVIAVRWGWPSRDWIARERLRARGQGTGHIEDVYGLTPFAFERSWYGNDVITVRTAGVAVPWAYLLLLAAARPLGYWRRQWRVQRRKVRRLQPPRCRRCGYDLRASPERCPECGEPVGRLVWHGRLRTRMPPVEGPVK